MHPEGVEASYRFVATSLAMTVLGDLKSSGGRDAAVTIFSHSFNFALTILWYFFVPLNAA